VPRAGISRRTRRRSADHGRTAPESTGAVLPSVLPELFTGIRLAVGFAWTTIVAAETVDGLPGIGGLAWLTKKTGQTDTVILAIIVIGLAAIALDQLVKQLERRTVPWRGHA